MIGVVVILLTIAPHLTAAELGQAQVGIAGPHIRIEMEPFNQTNGNANIPYQPLWKYTWCPAPYEESRYGDCQLKREMAAGTSGLISVTSLMIKAMSCCGETYCNHEKMSYACECNRLWFPLQEGAAGAPAWCCWVSSVCLISSVIIGGCAWAPWWNKQGCNLIKKVDINANHDQDNDTDSDDEN